ncbi:MAG: thioredoxin domain-containing protein [Nanoarchaeota archaeon]|nr:thioredoxin domain-containing protein [Nanoarchaeota archaeon]MBU1704790.1 thioredoxin domain-containing protein [Nanoarchaeota archaeon]
MAKKRNQAIFNFIIIAFILAYLTVAGFVLYKRELSMNPNNPGVSSLLDIKNINYLYDAPRDPNVDWIPFLGSENASVTFIAYLDIESQDSADFFNEDFQKIREEFINTQKIKYYQKHYITEEDYQQKTGRYRYVKTFLCVAKLDPEIYYDFYFDALTTKQGPEYYLDKYNISTEEMDNCISQEQEEMRYDILEIKNQGIIGKKQRFYLGIGGTDNNIMDGLPSYPTLSKSIKQYLFRVGDPV